MNLAGGIFGCCVLNKYISTNWVLSYLETLRPLVAPSLRSGLPQPRAFRYLNNLEPLVSMYNYYLYRRYLQYHLTILEKNQRYNIHVSFYLYLRRALMNLLLLSHLSHLLDHDKNPLHAQEVLHTIHPMNYRYMSLRMF